MKNGIFGALLALALPVAGAASEPMPLESLREVPFACGGAGADTNAQAAATKALIPWLVEHYPNGPPLPPSEFIRAVAEAHGCYDQADMMRPRPSDAVLKKQFEAHARDFATLAAMLHADPQLAQTRDSPNSRHDGAWLTTGSQSVRAYKAVLREAGVFGVFGEPLEGIPSGSVCWEVQSGGSAISAMSVGFCLCPSPPKDKAIGPPPNGAGMNEQYRSLRKGWYLYDWGY